MTTEAVDTGIEQEWRAYSFKERDITLDYKGVFWGRGIQEAIDTFMEANDELKALGGGWQIGEDQTSAQYIYRDEGCDPDDPEDFYTAATVKAKPSDYRPRGSVRYDDGNYDKHELGATCNDCYEGLLVTPPKRIRDMMDREDSWEFEEKIEDYTNNHYFYCPNCQKTGEQGGVS